MLSIFLSLSAIYIHCDCFEERKEREKNRKSGRERAREKEKRKKRKKSEKIIGFSKINKTHKMSQTDKRRCERVIPNCLWHTNNQTMSHECTQPIKQWTEKLKREREREKYRIRKTANTWSWNRLWMGHKNLSIVITCHSFCVCV